MRSRLLAGFVSALLLFGAACGGSEETPTEDSAASPSHASESSVASAGTAESRSGDFTVSIPEGWVSEPGNETSELYLRNETQPGMELSVVAAPIAGGEAELTDYVEGQREQVGAYTNVTEVTEAAPLDYPVADAPATTFDWFFRADTGAGKTDLVERRVVFVQTGRLYEMKLQSPVEQSEEAFAALDHILQSWSFGT